MPDEAPSRLEVGRVGRPHGLRGEVTVMLVTDRTERMQPGAVLHVEDRELVVEAARAQRDGWVVHFAGVTDHDGAEALRGAVLRADPMEAAPGELWVHEIVGCAVVDRDGKELGVVAAVQANPAHELLELDTGVLVPMPFVVDHGPGRIVVDLPEGLLDL